MEWGTIASIVSDMAEDPIVAIASPRQDFDGAVTEFFIGMLTAAFLPESEDAWRALWQTPPAEAELQARLDALPDAFDLDGDGPRFLQDLSASDLAEQPVEPIQDLLVNAKNSGLFIKPNVVVKMSRPAAAMALITMQSYSTAGGRGYRTSVRGGGPLTTLVDPRRQSDPETLLWHFLWANVETLPQLASRAGHDGHGLPPSSTYPWLTKTKTSEVKGVSTSQAEVHPLQAYFGMPRRIRLEFEDHPGICDITGRPDTRMVVGLRAKSYGTNYEGWWHPLSPYYPGKQPNELLPVHGQPGGIGWRDWLPLLHASDAAPGKRPALTVAHFGSWRAERLELTHHAIRVFGYDASNAKIRAWISSTLPAFSATDPERIASLASTVRSLVDATNDAAYVLQSAAAEALHARADETPGDLSYVKSALWSSTERWFYDEIERFMSAPDADDASADIKTRYHPVLADHAIRVFDDAAPSDATKPELLRRVIRARFGLVTTLRGGGKMGEKIFTSLGMVSPSEKRKRRAGAGPTAKKGAR